MRSNRPLYITLVWLPLLAGCGEAVPPGPPGGTKTPVDLQETSGKPWFTDVTAAAGIDFVHFDSATARHYLPEVMGSGVGFIDYDADGWIDLFCVQVGPLPGSKSAAQVPRHTLYRNNRNGTFSDVSKEAGLDKSGYGMGCAVGDYDNDGFDDLVVTYLDGISLFANRDDGHGKRRFEDVTASARLANPHWGTSCGWGDVDGDGFLDLYVCNYVEIDLENYQTCVNREVNQVYACPPTVFPFTSHKLFHNRGDGTFADVSAEAGIESPKPGAGLGVVLVDLDDDGRLDIYAANDMSPAYVFHNEGGLRFKDLGVFSGAALMPNGRFMAGMGVAIDDIDGTGRPSILVSNYQDEATMVFLNRGSMVFREWSYPSGLGPATLKTLGFGIALLDVDLDGTLDVAIANGHVVRNSEAIFHAPYEQQAQLLVGDGKGRFHDESEFAGSYFREKHVGRGLAIGDYDNDGRPDFAVNHNAGPLKLLHNATTTTNHWLRLDLVGDGTRSNRNAIGARVEIRTADKTLARYVVGGGSYLSANDRRLCIGLGAEESAERIIVVWPSGAKQEFANLKADTAWRLTEGQREPSQSTK